MRVSFEEHAADIASLLSVIPARLDASDVEIVPVDDPHAVGRVLGAELRSTFPLPPFDNSQMDGYAVLAEDLREASEARPARLRVGAMTAAGSPPVRHTSGTASPVMTGAPVPLGADAIVPIEEADPPRFLLDGVGEGSVRFTQPAVSGRFVRPAGSDLPEGGALGLRGERLTPARIGAIAAGGHAVLPLRRRARVLVVTTGEELAPSAPGAPQALEAGRIYDANGPMLAAAVREAGAVAEVVRSGDNPEAFLALLEARADRVDLVVTSGGVSAGAFEVVRDALEPRGVQFRSIAMQPGGPQGFGLLPLRSGQAVPVVCLPGNPVSSILSLELLVLPHLRPLAGLPPRRETVEVVLADAVDSPADKLQIRRGTLLDDGRVRLLGPSSHLLNDYASADVLAPIPLGTDRLEAGAPITVWRIA